MRKRGKVRLQLSTDAAQTEQAFQEPVMSLLFLLAGVYSLLFFLRSLDGISYSAAVIYPLAAVVSISIWLSYFKSKRIFCAVSAVLALICISCALFYREELTAQSIVIINAFSGGQGAYMSITPFVMLLTVLLIFIVFAFEFIIKSHALLYILTTGLLLLSPLWGVHISVETLLLTAVFQIAFLALETARLKHEKKVLSYSNMGSISQKSCIAISVLLVCTFVLASILTVIGAQQLYTTAYDAEGYAYRTLSNMSGRSSELVSGGQLHRGNNYRTGVPHLQVAVSDELTQPLYLRGFSGGDYIGGGWTEADDSRIYQNVADMLGWQQWADMVGSMYYTMYFVMNNNTNPEHADNYHSVTVSHVNNMYENIYVPYYGRPRSRWNSSLQGGYTYQFYDMEDMGVSWESVEDNFTAQRDWYYAMQQRYVEEAQPVYTRVPTELLPRLTQLVAENPKTELNEITEFILYTLNSLASYSLTPGWTPFNEDEVEYFLFESGQGYCEHFAAAAVLMYRMYGIPARYATGYAVPPDAFTNEGGVMWRATVTDENAHAWPEIFLPDYGWTPVEVTPSADGETETVYPGFDSSQIDPIDAENLLASMPTLDIDGDGGAQNDVHALTSDLVPQISRSVRTHSSLYAVIIGCFVFAVFSMPAVLDFFRMTRLIRLDNMQCRAVFTRLIKMLRFCKCIPQKADGTEENFEDVLSQYASESDAKQLIAKAHSAAYGNAPQTKEDAQLAHKVYTEAAKKLYGSLPRIKKLIFKYIKAFI